MYLLCEAELKSRLSVRIFVLSVSWPLLNGLTLNLLEMKATSFGTASLFLKISNRFILLSMAL